VASPESQPGQENSGFVGVKSGVAILVAGTSGHCPKVEETGSLFLQARINPIFVSPTISSTSGDS